MDKYQTVGFDGNRYSVPRRHAFRTVTIKGFIDRAFDPHVHCDYRFDDRFPCDWR